jgi:hypothetical protein
MAAVSVRQRFVAVVGALVLLGACGSSDDGASPTSPVIDATTTTAPFDSTAPCTAVRDAAHAASAAYYANNDRRFPATFTDLTAGPGAPLALDGKVPSSPTVVTGPGWTLTMTGDGTAEPTFECAATP